MSISRRIALTGLASLLLTACVGGGANFKTEYDPLGPDATRAWRLAEVRVSVPNSLTVSEAETLLPNADIVWREDPAGDRHAQVATIMKNAITQGAQGLRGDAGQLVKGQFSAVGSVIAVATTHQVDSLDRGAQLEIEGAAGRLIEWSGDLADQLGQRVGGKRGG